MSPYANGNSNGNGNGHGKGHGNHRHAVPSPIPPDDRLPPQNLEAERGVLGSILLDNEVLHEVIPLLQPPDFYRDAHQVVYTVVRELYDKGQPVDTLLLAEELQRREQYDRLGGDELIASIINSVPHAANALHYAVIVREKSVLRRLIGGAHEILKDSYDSLKSADEVLQTAERQIFRIAEEQASGETVDLQDIVTEAMDRIALRSESRHPITGIASGLLDLDDVTTGFQGSQLIILAARPSMGKTALALNICEHVAMSQHKAVLFVSLEMGKLEIADRMLGARAKVDGHKLRTGQGLGQRDMTMLGRAYDELRAGAPVLIDDTPTRNMLQITANARRIKLRQARTTQDLGLIIVDYIQLIEPDAGENRDSRQEQIAKISRRLKTLARELNVPVIALSQLNRGVENREDRRPRMADLRESGAIEQDADMVLLLHRPEYYDPNDQPGISELIVAKNRNGRTDTIKMTFLKNFMRFENLAAMADGPIDAGTF
jgi:replicative DNA helicase